MEQWAKERKQPLTTNDAVPAKLKGTPNDILRWESSFDRLLDLGVFYADTTERKVIVLELVCERNGKRVVLRECEVPVE